MNNFLSWCQQLGIENLNARAPVLTDAVKALGHESVLFFLCGRDYIYKPSDSADSKAVPLKLGVTGKDKADQTQEVLHSRIHDSSCLGLRSHFTLVRKDQRCPRLVSAN
jgi:hypothetical protein